MLDCASVISFIIIIIIIIRVRGEFKSENQTEKACRYIPCKTTHIVKTKYASDVQLCNCYNIKLVCPIIVTHLYTAIRWLFSFLNKRQQRVKLGSFLSDWAWITGGMPHRSWLAPFIFIIYIHRRSKAILSDWLHGLSDHLTILLCSTAGLVSVLD